MDAADSGRHLPGWRMLSHALAPGNFPPLIWVPMQKQPHSGQLLRDGKARIRQAAATHCSTFPPVTARLVQVVQPRSVHPATAHLPHFIICASDVL
jgi:hypothetical protein